MKAQLHALRGMSRRLEALQRAPELDLASTSVGDRMIRRLGSTGSRAPVTSLLTLEIAAGAAGAACNNDAGTKPGDDGLGVPGLGARMQTV